MKVYIVTIGTEKKFTKLFSTLEKARAFATRNNPKMITPLDEEKNQCEVYYLNSKFFKNELIVISWDEVE